MELVESFNIFIKANNLFSSKDKLVLAVSGGVDSVVLCELCKQAGYDFFIAHCNFQLRGEESERDEQFVGLLGEKYQVKVEVKKFDTTHYAETNKLSIQEAARDLRYQWFLEIVRREMEGVKGGSSVSPPTSHVYLLTAHHSDDNIETILMNFFRGTGLHGLTGIPAIGHTGEDYSLFTSYVRRPLLPFFKDELVRFARENKLEFVEDSSNQSSKYTRNFFRNEIVPAVSKVYPQVKENIQDNIERFKEIENLYKVAVAQIKNKLCKQKGSEIHIPVHQLMAYRNKALVYEIVSEYGFSEKQVTEVLKLADSESGRYIDSAGAQFRIIKHRLWFIITPIVSTSSEIIVIDGHDKKIQFPEGRLDIEETSNLHPDSYREATSNHLASLDAKEIHFPLLLRKWKAGDYFYPLGMKKKKKLARFFIDQKLSKTDKEKVWVIEMNKKIIWVVGHRIDDRFMITEKTKAVLRLTYSTKS